MKRVARNGLIIAAAASGAVAVTMPVYADSAADGGTAKSPGVISGNTIQLPVHVPVNVCGNTVNVVGLLNPAAGNRCANEGGHGKGGDGKGGAHEGSGGAVAEGGAKDSPGVISGNGIQLPVQLPVNVTGNSVSVVGIGNPAVGNESTNTSQERPHHPEKPVVPPAPKPVEPPKKPVRPAQPEVEPEAPRAVPHGPGASLAQTGTDLMGPTVAASAALMLGGAALYRRFRTAVTPGSGHAGSAGPESADGS
ncbi:chaplin [Streptomyces phaeochromogenes]|uniref:chaplin n=1 Tax=Streptomyces phaeochromogenes TaxID=1923 RepID=UPI0006E189FC|nr:chaplin [Streptomyces phaeochromogenes]